MPCFSRWYLLLPAVFLTGAGALLADQPEVRPAPAAPKAEQATEAEDAQPAPLPPHRADSPAFRQRAAMATLCALFAVKLDPEPGDTMLDLMPQDTEPLALVNPGFEFTYDDGKLPGKDFWIIIVREGKPGNIQGGMRGPSDPIQGWTAVGCAGLESGRPKQWNTAPDGCTGYIVAHGKDYTLFQTLEGALKPSTRYTLLVEVYKRNDYKRAEADAFIVKLTDGEDKPLDTTAADYLINPADQETGFAITAITLTTSADQKPGDLRIHLGMNAEGGVRLNFDNARLWAQPVR